MGNRPGGKYQPKTPADFTDAQRMLAGTSHLYTAKTRRGGRGPECRTGAASLARMNWRSWWITFGPFPWMSPGDLLLSNFPRFPLDTSVLPHFD